MPRPCQVSQCPGSASTYSPWRRSSNWRSSESWVAGSGRAAQISHLKTTETGIGSGALAALQSMRMDVIAVAVLVRVIELPIARAATRMGVRRSVRALRGAGFLLRVGARVVSLVGGAAGAGPDDRVVREAS